MRIPRPLLPFLVFAGTAAMSPAEVFDCEQAAVGSSQPWRVQKFNGINHEVVRIETGWHGGMRVIRKTRTTKFIYKDAKLEGSRERNTPAIVNKFAEKDSAAYLGFEVFPNGENSIPDLAEVNGAFAKVNAHFKDSGFFPIFFYSVKGKISDRAFLKHFAEEGSLPAADKGHYFHHDIPAHFTANFLPSELIAVSRRQAKAVLEFEAFFKESFPEQYSEKTFDAIIKKYAENIDYGNANYAIDVKKGKVSEGGYLLDGFEEFAASGASPVRFLMNRFEKLVAEVLNELSQESQVSFFNHAVDAFAMSKGSAGENPEFWKGLEPNQDKAWFEKTIEVKLIRYEAAVPELLSKAR